MSNDVAAYGTLGGLAYVAPWEKISAYKNQVRAEEKAIYAQNQQKLAKIASMEQEKYTALKAYDSALEPYYEGLHQEFGSIIQKYGDPEASWEGTHALKQVERKFLNNDIYNNAQLTKAAYANLQNDYANRRISQEDYDWQIARFESISGEGGDATQVYKYVTPNYSTDEEIIKATMGNYEQSNLYPETTLSKTVNGFTQDQFAKGLEMIKLDKSQNKQFALRIDQRMRNKLGNEAVDNMDEKDYQTTFDSTAYEQMRKQFPLNITKHQVGGGSGSGGSGQPKVAQVVSDMQAGSYSPTALANYNELNKDGSIANLNYLATMDSRTSVDDFRGKALPVNTLANLDAGEMKGTVRIPLSQYATGIHKRTEKYFKKITGTQGSVAPIPKDVDEKTFAQIGLMFGHSADDIELIKDKYRQGYYAREIGYDLIINGNQMTIPKEGEKPNPKTKNLIPLIVFAFESIDLTGQYKPEGISDGVLTQINGTMNGVVEKRSIDIPVMLPMLVNEKTAGRRNSEADNNIETRTSFVQQMNSIRASQMVTLSNTGSAVGKAVVSGETAVTAFLNQNTNEIYDMNKDSASLAEMSASDKWKNQLNEYIFDSFGNLAERSVQSAVERGKSSEEASDLIFTDRKYAEQFLANMFGSYNVENAKGANKSNSRLFQWYNTENNGSSYQSNFQILQSQLDEKMKPGGEYTRVMEDIQNDIARVALQKERKNFGRLEESEKQTLIAERVIKDQEKKPMKKVEFYNNLANRINPSTGSPYISMEDYSMLILGEALDKVLN